MGKIEDEAYRAATRALDRERSKNSIRAVLGVLFIVGAVVAICWYGLEHDWI